MDVNEMIVKKDVEGQRKRYYATRYGNTSKKARRYDVIDRPSYSSRRCRSAELPVEEEKQLPKGPFSNLAITDVSVSGSEVTISGNTDLPSSATLIVDFNMLGRSGSDLYIGVSKKTTISNGEFKVVLAIPQREELKNGTYEMSALFTPLTF